MRKGRADRRRRALREQLRLEAAERFGQGDEDAVIAHALRVSVRLFAVLGRGLRKGLAYGGPDQTWPLSRLATLVGRRFHESCTVQGTVALLKRHGWSCQVPPAPGPAAAYRWPPWPATRPGNPRVRSTGPARTAGPTGARAWKDCRDLVQTAHQQFGGPIVLVWGILNTHLTAGMRRYIAVRDWLTVLQLPPWMNEPGVGAGRDHGEGRPSAWL
ncbi:winged helix-turn-helix domain-containing protein [Streptomyces olivaceoviridis]